MKTNIDTAVHYTPVLNTLAKKWNMLECELYAFARCLEGFMPFETQCVGRVVEHPTWIRNEVETNIHSAVDVIAFEMFEYDRYSGFEPIGFTREELGENFLAWVNKLTCADLKQLPQALLYINACRELSTAFTGSTYRGADDMMPTPADSDEFKQADLKPSTPPPLNFYKASGEAILSYFNDKMSDILYNDEEIANWEKYKNDVHIKKNVQKFVTALKDKPITEGLKSSEFINQYVKHNNAKRTLINKAINFGLMMAIQERFIETINVLRDPNEPIVHAMQKPVDEVTGPVEAGEVPTIKAYREMLLQVEKQLIDLRERFDPLIFQYKQNQEEELSFIEFFDRNKDILQMYHNEQLLPLFITALLRKGFKLHISPMEKLIGEHHQLIDAIQKINWIDDGDVIDPEAALTIESWLLVPNGNQLSLEGFQNIIIGISVLELIRERVTRDYSRSVIVCFERALQPVTVSSSSEENTQQSSVEEKIMKPSNLKEVQAFLAGVVGNTDAPKLTPEEVKTKTVAFTELCKPMTYWEPETAANNFGLYEAISSNLADDTEKALFASYVLNEVNNAVLVFDLTAPVSEETEVSFSDKAFGVVVDITTFPKLAFGAVVTAIPFLS